MIQHFQNGEAKWCSFDTSSPQVVGLEEGSQIEEAEVSKNDEGKWCTNYPSVPEDMNTKIDAFVPEDMFQHFLE
jgi:hypothetical protein